METHRVELGDRTLHGHAERDPFSGLLVSAINGWRGLSAARGSRDSIPGAHGSYSATSLLRDERSIEVVGAAVASTEGEAIGMIDALEAELAAAPVEMRVHDASGVWSREVEVQAVTIMGRWASNRIRFAIDAVATDPVRYRDPVTVGPIGLPVRSGGLVLPSSFPWNFGSSIRPALVIENEGSVQLAPTITVIGAADSISVHGGAQQLVFGAFNGTLTLDAESRRAWLNSRDVTRLLTRRDWPVIKPGASAQYFFDAVNAAENTAMTVTYQIGAW